MNDTLIRIDKIIVKPGRRELDLAHVQSLADSMAENGLMCSITVGANYNLIAGLHRLEAAKRLGWMEIECTVLTLTDLQAELAEIDENIIRRNLDTVERGEKLLRRKEIYEELHPESKNGGDRKSENFRTKNFRSDSAKSFVLDTADKLGVTPRTVEMQIQAAKNMTPEAKKIIRGSKAKITQESALKLSRLNPEQQSEAATMLASGEIRSMDEYRSTAAEDAGKTEPEAPALPFSVIGKHFDSFADALADMKNPDKDCSATPDTFLAEVTCYVRQAQEQIAWYGADYYAPVFPRLTAVQMEYLHGQIETICSAAEDLYKLIERIRNHELSKKAQSPETRKARAAGPVQPGV